MQHTLRQDPHLDLQHKLLMNASMKQALHVMQLSVLELAEWVKTEVENNPAFEIALPDSNSFTTETFSYRKIHHMQQSEILENVLPAQVSLFDHLMAQARYHFSPEELPLAQWIIGHLDERGFLNMAIEEIDPRASLDQIQKCLNIIQTFDPPGVGAQSLQDTLLIQLKLKKKRQSIAYSIIADYFDDFLHKRYGIISKKLHISVEQVAHIVKRDITPLDLHPGDRFQKHYPQAIIPDLFVLCIDDVWKVEVNESCVPAFHLALTYRQAIEKNQLSSQENLQLRKFLTAGNWLKHILAKRKTTLLNIGNYLLKKQFCFFQNGTLAPLKMAEVAQALGLHTSTIARAAANKYLCCPQGIFAIKHFFSHTINEHGDISRHTLRQKLKGLIEAENKQHPYSDAELKSELDKMGICCARRTVTKYRKLLRLASACQRKQWLR